MKALFLVNARSGPNRKRDVASIIRNSCDWEGYELTNCERKEDLDGLIDHAQRDGFDVIFAVGGDGTVHEVAKRLIGTPLALAVIPTGSGNGFARDVGFPLDPVKAIAACSNATVVPIDTGDVNGEPFISVFGVGFDAYIAARFEEDRSRGFKTYLRVGARALRDYEAVDYEVSINGETFRERAFFVAVANSTQYGNNGRIAPQASMRDGLLDVVILRHTPLWAAPIITARLFLGTIDRSKAVISRRAEAVIIRRADSGLAHLDGEPVTLPRELQVRVRPRSLNVLVPAASVAHL